MNCIFAPMKGKLPRGKEIYAFANADDHKVSLIFAERIIYFSMVAQTPGSPLAKPRAAKFAIAVLLVLVLIS